ncbi:MFS transporter [Kitasatospora cathayae]|uniref:MFS transporter n=1 Tax=Kitasatospora cathayae TaxID=3004092 RepID=A0ABY7Q0M7_9ACTN|nr:MFS transporter [Kitasatospora sp. HUAS 3-15]WBP86179.1 MFS transporter [Kitasatospora sp. HUAS 3-15]
MTALLPDRGPRRLLALATLVYTVGYGVYLTAGVLYFTRVVDLPASQVGIGLSVAGGVSLAAGVPVGHLADRHGARGVYAGTLLLWTAAMGGLCLAHGFGLFLLFAALAAVAQSTGPAARGPLIKEYGGDRPAEFRAYLRSVTNVGIAVGALLAGWGAQVGTARAYLLLIGGSAVCSLACAAVVMRLPVVAPTRAGSGPRWVALRDRPYVLVTVLDGVMAVQYRVLTAAVPLWILDRSSAPRWSVSAVMLVNTAIVVCLQVRASKGIDTPRAGAVAFRRAGFAFLISCGAISLTPSLPAWVGLALLLGAVVVHTVGEIWHAAGGFELSFSLAPAEAVGQYQGLFGMGLGLGVTIGPALVIALCVTWGTPGWWVLGAVLALTGLTVPPAVRWAQRELAKTEAAAATDEPAAV